jgi:RNA polymerase sigma-70 factor (ECF subfamily)
MAGAAAQWNSPAMSDSSLDTTQLRAWLERLRGGDAGARDDLLRSVQRRLQEMTHRMLRRFPGVRRWEETDDVLQNALVRLARALEAVNPASTREFFGLAAEQIRRELLDLARRYGHPPRGTPGNPETIDAPGDTGPQRPAEDADLERWSAFHEAVTRLPATSREVVGLVFYHGWTQVQVAELFTVSERTVRRWWHDACLQLHQELGGRLPEW